MLENMATMCNSHTPDRHALHYQYICAFRDSVVFAVTNQTIYDRELTCYGAFMPSEELKYFGNKI